MVRLGSGSGSGLVQPKKILVRSTTRNFQTLVSVRFGSVRFGLVRFGYCHFGSINRSGPNRYRTKASFKILTKQFSS